MDLLKHSRVLLFLALNFLSLITTAALPSVTPLNPLAYQKSLFKNANLPLNTTSFRWPVKAPLPKDGALLPMHRIVAYYGNFYSKRMGVLGEYPRAEVLSRLATEVAAWEKADPTTPVIPAIEYIASVAQKDPQANGYYITRMPKDHIDRAINMAGEIEGIVILDIQLGTSSVEIEVPLLESYLSLPNVMLALDPEFSMQPGQVPGTKIGSMDATDINFVVEYLAALVKTHNLPPKILIIHRFTEHMVTNYELIQRLPEVQIVMDMDGWGSKTLKRSTYNEVIVDEPVEFTGFKLFYKNDLKPPSKGLYTPAEILKLSPQPVFIMYQ